MKIFPTPRLLAAFQDYEAFHQTPGNKTCHWIGIPLVTFSLLGLLGKVVLFPVHPVFPIDLGIVLFLVGAIYAFRQDPKIGFPFSVLLFAVYLFFRDFSLPILIVLQTFGWFLQLWGHYRYEKKSPAFFSNLESLIVGPIWIFARTIQYYRSK